MNLCQLCLQNQLPFMVRRNHWSKGYILVTSFDSDKIKAGNNNYFKVYGEYFGPGSKRNIINFDGSIRNSGVYSWSLFG